MKTNARLESVNLRAGEKPKTVLTFVTTQPADEYNLGKTVSEKMGLGKLAAGRPASPNRNVDTGKLTLKVANPTSVAAVAEVTIKLTLETAEPRWAELLEEDFNLAWEPAKRG
jgi:hypothetical protein